MSGSRNKRPLSQTAEAIYRFIALNLDENRVGPTVRQIVAGVGLASTSVAAHHLRRLEEAGRIERPLLYGQRRIMLAEAGRQAVSDGSEQAV